MHQESIIQQTVSFVQEELKHAEGGHDWFHIERVWRTSKYIAGKESVPTFAVELGALLHDIADSKFHGGDEEIGPMKAKEFLTRTCVDQAVIDEVIFIIRHISFKGGHNEGVEKTPALMVVQDADRLDALGAIGIARAFNFGGFKNRPLYDPAISPEMNLGKEEYKRATSPTINHFYEKLLKLKDLMNTATGRQMAIERHQFMELYLDQFYKEWEAR